MSVGILPPFPADVHPKSSKNNLVDPSFDIVGNSMMICFLISRRTEGAN